MSKFFHLTKKSKKIYRRKKMFPAMKIGLKTVNIVIVVLIAVVGISYLVQVNDLATKGYQIEELENRITELQQEGADLELNVLSLQSMGTVKERVDDLGMVLAGESDYLQPTPVAVAR